MSLWRSTKLKEVHKAYTKYIALIQVIPKLDLEIVLKTQQIVKDKAQIQIQLLQEELKRRDLR